jgi:hypothetical protein
MALKLKNSDAGSASKATRSNDVLLIIDKVKILDMTELEKNPMRGLAGCVAGTRLPFAKTEKLHCKCTL